MVEAVGIMVEGTCFSSGREDPGGYFAPLHAAGVTVAGVVAVEKLAAAVSVEKAVETAAYAGQMAVALAERYVGMFPQNW